MHARIPSLLRRFNRLTMADWEDVMAFSWRLTAFVGEIRSLGENVPEKTMVHRLFASMPRRFLPIISTIEQWGDIGRITVAKAVGRLYTFEESESDRPDDRGGREGRSVASGHPRAGVAPA